MLSIAIFPLAAPHFWEHHQGKIAAAWAILFVLPLAGLGLLFLHGRPVPRAAILAAGAGCAVVLGGEALFQYALTGDPLQWARLVAQAGSWPDLTLGGATYAWIAAARAECRRLAALPSPDLPALIGLGGAEAVVSRRAVQDRAAAWAGIDAPKGRVTWPRARASRG